MREFKEEEQVVRTILNDWDPISGSPKDEFDCLVHRILSNLHQIGQKEKLLELIQDQLSNHFGLDLPQDQISNTAKKIWTWWTEFKPDKLSGL